MLAVAMAMSAVRGAKAGVRSSRRIRANLCENGGMEACVWDESA